MRSPTMQQQTSITLITILSTRNSPKDKLVFSTLHLTPVVLTSNDAETAFITVVSKPIVILQYDLFRSRRAGLYAKPCAFN